jgi:hypothetical protein
LLQKIDNDKFNKEELVSKIIKFKQNKNQSRNLQQLVELTKSFMSKRRQEQIADNETCRQAAKTSVIVKRII